MTPEDWAATVGAELRRARKARRLSQAEAGLRAGLSGSTWTALEKGYHARAVGRREIVNPDQDTLRKAAQAVGLDPRHVFELAGRVLPPDLMAELRAERIIVELPPGRPLTPERRMIIERAARAVIYELARNESQDQAGETP